MASILDARPGSVASLIVNSDEFAEHVEPRLSAAERELGIEQIPADSTNTDEGTTVPTELSTTERIGRIKAEGSVLTFDEIAERPRRRKLALGIGGVVIAVIAAVVLLRRRKA